LINLKTVIDIPINKNITQVFMNNTSLLMIKNKDDKIYSTPVIGYYKTFCNDDDAKIKDYSCVDIFTDKINDALGNYYSFNADMPYINENKNEVVMRAALFLIEPCLNNNNTLLRADSIIFNKNRIRYAIKNYNQHTPLSFH
jgi:hypothetical protein